MKFDKIILVFLCCLCLVSCGSKEEKTGDKEQTEPESPITIYLIGDSTMADYSGDYDDRDYMKTRYPVMGQIRF